MTAKVGGGAATGVQELKSAAAAAAAAPTPLLPSSAAMDCEGGGLSPPSGAAVIAAASDGAPLAEAGKALPGTAAAATATAAPRRRPRSCRRPYLVEAACCLYFCGMAAYAGQGGQWTLTGYCSAMAVAFATLSLGGSFA